MWVDGGFSLSELADYNQAASSVCMQFFLSRGRYPELDYLQDPLRRKVNHLIKKSIREGIKEFVVQPHAAEFRFQTEATQVAQTPLAFQLRFADLATNPSPENWERESRTLSLSHATRKFSADRRGLPLTMNEIDRGFEPQNPIRTTDDQRIWVAMPLRG